MNNLFTACLILSLLLPKLTLAESKPSLKAVDLFGSNQLSTQQIQQRFGDKFKRLVNAIYVDKDFDVWMKLHQEIISEIRQSGKFSYVELSTILYSNNDVYLTVDIVDETDASTRMIFSPPPKEELSDPDGLLALWAEYQNAGQELWRKGELDYKKMRCPALHCVYGFDHPALKKYEQLFQTGVPKNKKALIRILREDRDAQHRANAAFLLAHLDDPFELTQLFLQSITDPAEMARNNVMRVLGAIAEKRKEVPIPVEPIIKALNYPATTDRNKALYVLDGLAENPKNKGIIISQAGSLLIRLLRLYQPNNHDYAYSILKKVSGKNYGERDYKAWEEWLGKANASKG